MMSNKSKMKTKGKKQKPQVKLPDDLLSFMKTGSGQVSFRLVCLSFALQHYAGCLGLSGKLSPTSFSILNQTAEQIVADQVSSDNFVDQVIEDLKSAQEVLSRAREASNVINTASSEDINMAIWRSVGITCPDNKMMLKSFLPSSKTVIINPPKGSEQVLEKGLPSGTKHLKLVDTWEHPLPVDLVNDKIRLVIVSLEGEQDDDQIIKDIDSESSDAPWIMFRYSVDDSVRDKYRDAGFRAIKWNEESMGPDIFFNLDRTDETQSKRVYEVAKEFTKENKDAGSENQTGADQAGPGPESGQGPGGESPVESGGPEED